MNFIIKIKRFVKVTHWCFFIHIYHKFNAWVLRGVASKFQGCLGVILKYLILNSITIIFILSFKVYSQFQNNTFNFLVYCQTYHTFTQSELCIEIYIFQKFDLLFVSHFPKKQTKCAYMISLHHTIYLNTFHLVSILTQNKQVETVIYFLHASQIRGFLPVRIRWWFFK